MSETRALILGCGYVGLRLARRLVRDGIAVTGTTRTPDRFPEIEAAGARPMLAEVMEPATLPPLAEWEPDVVFDLVRPQRIDRDRYTVWGTHNVAAALAGTPLEALVYLSSTSVYGRREGEWTDEETPVNPSSPLGQARVESEEIYLELFRERGFPARICRVPGIYGPGRTLRERLETGAYTRSDDETQWVSRIHVDDLVSGLIAAWRAGRTGEIYLLSDSQPVTAREYAELTANLLSLPLPPPADRQDIRQELTKSAFERRVAARRCSNRRMREELGVVLQYPTIHEGVPAALQEEGAL
ncbi:MAG TPA: NAD-dependent epimerase/dehydratase family protein [Longimicrobiaceae bacterium]|nr:NAD-dependent epimerase/dehydratase family protein [Longimicrobiaceae bacterium]